MNRLLLVSLVAATTSISVQAKDWVESQTLHILNPQASVNVYGSGGTYKTVPDQPININTMVEAQCKGNKRLKSHKLVGGNDPQSGSVIEGVGSDWAHMTITNPDSGRPNFSGLTNMLLKSKVSKYPSPLGMQPGEVFVNACNARLNHMVNHEGKSKFSLLKNGFTTQLAYPVTLQSRCVKKNNSNKSYWESIVKHSLITLNCKPIQQGPGGVKAPAINPIPKGPGSIQAPSKQHVPKGPSQLKAAPQSQPDSRLKTR